MRMRASSLFVVVVSLSFIFLCASGARCTTDQYAAFREPTIAGPLNKCKSATEVQISLPPTVALTEPERLAVCEERVCKSMIAAIDDMDVPRCELVVNNTNMTLLAALDLFTAMCDGPRTAVPSKKLTPKKAATSGVPMLEPFAGVGAAVTAVVFSIIVVCW